MLMGRGGRSHKDRQNLRVACASGGLCMPKTGKGGRGEEEVDEEEEGKRKRGQANI